MARNISALLRKPYIDIDVGDGGRPVRIPASKKDIERIRKGSKEFDAELKAFADPDGDASIELLKEALEFLCGPEAATELYTRCLGVITEGMEGDYSPDDLTFQFIPVLEAVEFEWLDYIGSMEAERSEHVNRYLNLGSKNGRVPL